MKTIMIQTPFIKLDQLLKFAAVVGSGGDAKALIANKCVNVNGEICLMRGKKIKHGDFVTIQLDAKNIELKVESYVH